MTVEQVGERKVYKESCPQCNKIFEALTESGARGALQLHLRKKHGGGSGRAPKTPRQSGGPPAQRRPAAPEPTHRQAEGGHAHRWRLLRPDNDREKAAIKRGYVQICDECHELK